MTRFLLFLLCQQIFFSTFCIAETITCRVVSVSDGDTFTVSDRTGKTHKVRLYGIDAPESEQKSGKHAYKMLSAMVVDKHVGISVAGTDRNGIPNVHAYLNGASINAAMVKSGCAWVDQEICKNTECKKWKEYQQLANSRKKGIWQEAEVVPPWTWRERHNKAQAIAKGWEEANENFVYDHLYSYRKGSSGYKRSSGNRKKTQRIRSYARNGGATAKAPKQSRRS